MDISKITNIFNNKIVLYVIIGVLIFLMLKGCQEKRDSDLLHRQNEEAMKKEMTVSTNKAGELQTSIVAYEGSTKDLKNYSAALEKEVDKLKGVKPKVIIQIQTEYLPADTLEIMNKLRKLGKDQYALDWKYHNEDSTRILEGSSDFTAIKDTGMSLNIKSGKTYITKDLLKLDFTVGVATNKKTGFDEIFVTSKSKDVRIGKLEGAILDKKPEKMYGIILNARSNISGSGVSIIGGGGLNITTGGYSINLTGGYGATFGSSFKLGPSMTISANRTIFKF